MHNPLSPSAAKVQAILNESGIAAQVLEMPATTRSARDAAAAVGCTVGQIAKSLVFRASASSRPVLVITSGANRVDEAAVGALIREGLVKADADFVRDRTGFAIGGVPPVGHGADWIIFLDEDLFQYDLIWAAAGTPRALFQVTPLDLQRITGAKVVRVKSDHPVTG